MCKLFSRKYTKKDLKCIEEIKKTALQINLGEVDAYRNAIRKFLECTGEEINSYFSNLGKDYFIVMTYYSHLIKDSMHGRISEPINVEEKIKNEEEREFAMQLIQWYENKWEKKKAFSLVPISLKSHKLNQPPQKYCLILSNPKKYHPLDDIKKIDISSCYEDQALWNKIIRIANGSNFEEVIINISKNSDKLRIKECLKEIVEVTGEKYLKEESIPPFILAWYPTHKGWPYQYYIPSPMLSDTPVGGLLVGTNTILGEEDIVNLEDIALKVTVDINLIEHKEKVLQQSRRTAVSAIMGRNMSHNIGSHVIWHLAQNPAKKKEISKEDIEKQNNFYNYIRERMGFIGLISTTSPSWVLEYDFSKVIDNFKNQDLLLQNLVKTEKKALKIKIICKKDTCEKDIELPHGSYGAHAFFTILENIIRNTVKHNITHVNSEITFTISLEDPENYKDYVRVKITDSLGTYSKDLDALIKDLNEKAKENIIDEDGKLINKHLGFKEKRICAAFLRRIPQEAVDCECKLPLLQVEKNDKNLAHVIYLKKPKKALIVTENENLLLNKDDLLNKGFYVEKYEKQKRTFANIKDFTHQFLVLDVDINGETRKFIEENKQRLPFRILEKGDYKEESIPTDTDDLNLFLWKKWFVKYFDNKDGRGQKKIQLIENKTKEWEETINNQCDNKIEVIREKRPKDDHAPDNSIVLSHDIKIDINKNVFKNAFFVEGIMGDGTDGLYEMIKSLRGSPYLLYKLLESFLFKIVIVDERIYEKVDDAVQPQPSNKWNGQIKFTQLWEKRQVKIIDHDKIIENDNWYSILESGPDILIIHLGVIDKYKDTHKTEKFNSAWENIKKNIKYIIIDSDRGRSDDIKEMGARWLHFSELSNIVIDKRDMNIAKYLLVSLVTAVRED